MSLHLKAAMLSFVAVITLTITSVGQESHTALMSWSKEQSTGILVDTLWNLTYPYPIQARVIANELRHRGEAKNDYIAYVNGLEGIGDALLNLNQLDSGEYYYKLAETLARKEKDYRELAHITVSLGSLALSRNMAQESIGKYEEAIELWELQTDTLQICYTLIRLGNANLQFDRLSDGMKPLVRAVDLGRKIGHRQYVAHAYQAMSTIHKKQRNLNKAIELSDSAIHIYSALNDDWGLGWQLNNHGILLKDVGDYANARKVYGKGIALLQDHPRAEDVLLGYYVNLGILDNLEGRVDSSIYNVNKALEIARKLNAQTTLSDCMNELARSYLLKEDYRLALDTIQRAIHYAQAGESLEKEIQARDTQSKIYQAMGKYNLALDALQEHRILSDSMFMTEKTATIDRLQTEYETESKEQEINNLQKQAELEASRSGWLLTGLITSLIAVLAILFAFSQKRRKDKQIHQKQLELTESENLRLHEQLDFKRRELTEKALHLAQKNELLNSLKTDLISLKETSPSQEVNDLTNKIKFDEQIDQNWKQFMLAFTETKSSFFDKLQKKHPDVSANELRLSALLSMKLSSKEIASVLSISDAGVKKARYRLRKKIGLNTEDSLELYLDSIS